MRGGGAVGGVHDADGVDAGLEVATPLVFVEVALNEGGEAVDAGGASFVRDEGCWQVFRAGDDVFAAVVPQAFLRADNLESSNSSGLGPGCFDGAVDPRTKGEMSDSEVVNGGIDPRLVADGRPNLLDFAKERSQQMNGMGSHVHERPTTGKFRVVEPSQFGIVEPAAIGGVMGIAEADAGNSSQDSLPCKPGRRPHLAGKRLEVPAKNGCVAGLQQRLHDLQVSVGGHQGLLAKNGVAEGDDLFEEGPVTRILGANNKSVDLRVVDGLVEILDETRAGGSGVLLPALRMVVPNRMNPPPVPGFGYVVQERTGVDVRGGEKGQVDRIGHRGNLWIMMEEL